MASIYTKLACDLGGVPLGAFGGSLAASLLSSLLLL